MGCDIHIITEIKGDKGWTYVPEYPESLENRDYRTFAALAGVRDSFNTCIFKPKGLPADISGKKFRFKSDGDYIRKTYLEESGLCLVVNNKFICEEYDSDNELNKKTRIEITELEYEQLSKLEKDSWGTQAYNLRYRNLGWCQTSDKKTYYVHDATIVNGVWKKLPYKDIYPTFEEFTKHHFTDYWDEDAKDFGIWSVNFEFCKEYGDYHTPSYISLAEFLNADYSNYTAKKYKIDNYFFDDFVAAGGKLPDCFSVEESGIGDIRDAFAEAVHPTRTIVWQPLDGNKDGPLFKGIEELKKIAKKYNIENPEDIRIVFAFDN